MSGTSHDVTIEPASWSDAAAAWLLRAVENKRDALADLESDVRTGVAQLMHVVHAGKPVAACVLRIDRYPSGAEGVIVAAGGKLAGARLLDLLPEFERRFAGVRAIRIHTARRGMVRALARAGYRYAETILEKPCSAME